MIDNSDCLYCKLVSREMIPAEILAEDTHSLTFLDIHPQAPGHTLVIPKVHAPSLAELPKAEVGPLFETVQNLAGQIVRALKSDGLTIGVNQGPASGQTIPHLHIHLFPRFVGDCGKSVHSVVNNPPREDLKSIAEKIRQAGG